jgi:hypothetical protein
MYKNSLKPFFPDHADELHEKILWHSNINKANENDNILRAELLIHPVILRLSDSIQLNRESRAYKNAA